MKNIFFSDKKNRDGNFPKKSFANRKFWQKIEKLEKLEKNRKNRKINFTKDFNEKVETKSIRHFFEIFFGDFVGTVSICFAAQRCRETVSLVHINNLY